MNGSAPPSGECSSAKAAASSSRSGSSAQRSSSNSGATAGWVANGRSSAWVTVGTPAARSARRTRGSCPPARTSTAIRDQGTCSRRWISRSRYASQVCSVTAARKVRTITVPGPRPGRWAGTRARCRAGPRSRRATRPAAASSLGAARKDRVRVSTGAGAPAAVGNWSGNSTHPLRVTAAEAEGRRIRVGEDDQVGAAAGDLLQQLPLRRVGVGELIHVDRDQPLPLGGEQARVGGEHPDRGPHQLSVVVPDRGAGGGVPQRQHRLVLGHEGGGGTPLLAAQAGTQPVQLGGGDPPLDRAEHQVAQLRGEGPGRQRGGEPVRPPLRRPLQQLPDHHILLGAGQQTRRRLAGGRRGPPQQTERVGVEGAYQGLVDGAGGDEPVGDPLTQGGGAPAPEGQHQHPLRVSALGHPGRYRLHQGGGLTGARPADHQQGAVPVRHHRPLCVVRPRHRRVDRAPHQPVRVPPATHGSNDTMLARHPLAGSGRRRAAEVGPGRPPI